MNVSEIPQIQHLYSRLSGKTLNWIGTDQEETFRKNQSDPVTHERLLKSGWQTDTVIEYRLNSHGFRCPEFDDSPKIIALGCSFTFGVGLHEWQAWPTLLSNEIGRPIWNLSTGSGSLDTCYRVLDNYLPFLNIDCVILCEPSQDRFEIWDGNIVLNHINPGQARDQTKKFTEFWYSSDKNQILNREKNILSMEYICKKNHVRFINFQKETASRIYYETEPDESRCLAHLGPRSHEKIFRYVLELYLENQGE